MDRVTLFCSTAVGVLVFALAATPALAQSDALDPSITAEIIVTAQKREERLIDVPQSINVVTGRDIERFNLFNFADIQKLVPGLDISGGTVSLRGVKFNALSLTRPTVDIYFNEVLSERAAQIQSQYDVGQIEVLRGPQGTLRAGTGPSGAILIGTRRASLTDVEGYLMGSLTNLHTVNIQGAFSLPIVRDKLGLRVAGLYEKGRGADVRGVVNDIRDRSETWSGRASVAWAPTPDLRFDLVHQELDADAIALAQVEGTGEFGTISARDRRSVADGANRNGTRTSITTLNASWDLPGHRLSYIGGRQTTTYDLVQDLDTGNGLLSTPFFRLPVELYNNTVSRTRVWTHELRLERTGEHFWNYRVGIYRQNTNLDARVLIDFTGANGNCLAAPGPLAAFGLPCTQVDTSDAPHQIEMGYFTTHRFTFTPDDIVEVGARRSTTPFGNAWTGSASYTHQFHDDLSVYASWGRGFRPGGDEQFLIESNPQIPANEFGYRAEKSDSFEVGVKGLFFDDRLSFTLAGYYQKFDGFISNVQGIVCTGNPNGIGLIPGTVFATRDGLPPDGTNPCGSGSLGPTYNGDASVRGIELDMRLVMMAGWTSQFTASYANAHFDNAAIPCNDYNGDGEPDTNGIPAVQAGRYFSRCNSRASLGSLPKWQISANTEYSVALGKSASGYIRGLVNYAPSAEDSNDGRVVPSTFRADAFAGVTFTRLNASIEVFGRNIFNERTRVAAGGPIFSLFGAPTGYSPVTVRRPREVGVLARVNF
ncbi:TonB-dependent receptor [Sphingobium herbicidovorans]|uniref:TonB-dependent receptor n=1 Tax=Sphingobium herbicidovorans TaxID=76947 RepID=UPI001C3FDAC8|nr:TonB-dependent receptor [Sphingobium herbicidovorans]